MKQDRAPQSAAQGTEGASEEAERSIADVRLGAVARWGILATVLSIFFFGDGPIWDHPFNIDIAVWWSYAPIPVLTALALALQRRLSLLTFSLNTMELSLSKFAITYIVATVLWAASERPQPLRGLKIWSQFPSEEPQAEPPPAATPWPEDRRFRLKVEVSVHEKPAADIVVYVAEGLDALNWSPPRKALAMVWPSQKKTIVVAHPFQHVWVQAQDKRMHAIQLVQGQVRNARPLLPSGDKLNLELQQKQGIYRLHCSIHQEDSQHLLVLHHPHAGLSNAKGVVQLEKIPKVAAPLRIAAWHPTLGSASKKIGAPEGSAHAIRIALHEHQTATSKSQAAP